MRKTHSSFAPLALSACLALAFGGAAQAQSAAPVAISIASQPLGQALNELARQAGLQLSFPAALVAGKTAPAVVGQLTARQALDRVLAGSGLAASLEGGEAVVRPVFAPQGPGGAAVLPAVTVTAQGARG
ncbi:MAG TPA: STN domain-containing protein, partial [Pseudorhodoferax sp.]|nr:STN domain-containing protein [Pseudorhodoferax sp.]